MSMQAINAIFYIIVLIMSIVIHEFAHGYAAYLLGDNTARQRGRLTLNPIKHLDLFGSIILPALLYFTTQGTFLIGWAKPVPYNPENLRNEKRGKLIVAAAGIAVNFIIAIIFGLLVRFTPHIVPPEFIASFANIASYISFLNLVLAFFNLIPIPPLDGSKILFSFLPYKYRNIENFLEKWGMFVLLFFIVFLWGKFSPVIKMVFDLITGFN